MIKEDIQYLKGWGLSILIVIVIAAHANADIKVRTGEKIQCEVEL
jgi:hypothetical protein